MSSAICFNLDQSKMLSSGNGLNRLPHTLLVVMTPILYKKNKLSSYQAAIKASCPVRRQVSRSADRQKTNHQANRSVNKLPLQRKIK